MDYLSTEAFDGDSDHDVVDWRFGHCEIFIKAAKTMNIQLRLSKSKFAQGIIHLLGFKLGRGLRFVDPGKAVRIESWPAPSSLDDVVSFRAYCNYVREFIPSFSTLEAPLRPYMRKGAKFQEYLNDSAATGAFKKLKTALATEVGLATLDYTAALDAASGRPSHAARGFRPPTSRCTRPPAAHPTRHAATGRTLPGTQPSHTTGARAPAPRPL